MLTQELFDKITYTLVRTFNPMEIYLFGSYAWGTPDEESDVDLLIVLEKCDPKDLYKATVAGYSALGDIAAFQKDIIIIDKKEFDQAITDPTRLFYKIKQKGKVLYARA